MIARPNYALVGKENIFLHKKFLSKGMLKDITEQETFLDCKQKHMMKSVAPPDKVGILHRLLPIEFIVPQAELISKGYYSLVLGHLKF